MNSVSVPDHRLMRILKGDCHETLRIKCSAGNHNIIQMHSHVMRALIKGYMSDPNL